MTISNQGRHKSGLLEGEKQRAPHSVYFKKACEKAGARVFRRIPDVEGFVVYGLRTKTTAEELKQKQFVGDVYSQIDTSFDPASVFVANFLTKREWEARWYTPNKDDISRYSLIEVPGSNDGVPGFFQYTDASVRSEFKTNKVFSVQSKSVYAVRIEDVSTPVDREHWVAGTKWTVLDAKANEVLGEFVAYAIDPLQGQTVFSGGFGNAGEPWSPWLRAGHVQYKRPGLANACPDKDIYQKVLNARDFVRSVLVPHEQQVTIIPVAR